jgi:hypothetical protein
VRVTGVEVDGSRLRSLQVQIHGLPARTLDRATALAWLRDGHSLLPALTGGQGPALGIVDVDGEAWIRADGRAEARDWLGV